MPNLDHKASGAGDPSVAYVAFVALRSEAQDRHPPRSRGAGPPRPHTPPPGRSPPVSPFAPWPSSPARGGDRPVRHEDR